MYTWVKLCVSDSNYPTKCFSFPSPFPFPSNSNHNHYHHNHSCYNYNYNYLYLLHCFNMPPVSLIKSVWECHLKVNCQLMHLSFTAMVDESSSKGNRLSLFLKKIHVLDPVMCSSFLSILYPSEAPFNFSSQQ